MASAIGILDSNADSLISRIYTTDIIPLDSIFKSFKSLQQSTSSPIIHDESIGVNFIYIKTNELMIVCVTYYEHINCMTLLHFLYKLKEILLNYFKTMELTRDLIIDNFNLIYELFDEVMDFGIPQFTDFTILRDYIKLELNESEIINDETQDSNLDTDEYINTSILRTTTSNISWRPKGIFYRKNEFFVDIIEKITMIMDTSGKISKHEIHGSIDIKSYLSGMPIIKINLNKSNLEKFQFHQCVELDLFNKEKIIQFIPLDGKFILGTYLIPIKSKPIVELLEHEYIMKNNNTKIMLKLNIRTNFKQRAQINYLKIIIPIDLNKFNIDKTETPMFKTKIGKVLYKIDHDCISWEIDTLGGEREYTMMALFQLESEILIKKELGMDPPPKRTTPRIDKLQQELDSEIIIPKDIVFQFLIPDITWSGLKVEYLKIEESQLNYPSFPWVRYKTISDEYIYRL